MPGIERRTGQGGEDHDGGTPRHPRFLVLPLLPLLMEEESSRWTGGDANGPAGALRLGRDLDQPLSVLSLERLRDLHGPFSDIDLVAGQPRYFPALLVSIDFHSLMSHT